MYTLSYLPTSDILTDTCTDVYKVQIQNQLVTLINALESLCQNEALEINIMQASGDPVAVTIQTRVGDPKFLNRQVLASSVDQDICS